MTKFKEEFLAMIYLTNEFNCNNSNTINTTIWGQSGLNICDIVGLRLCQTSSKAYGVLQSRSSLKSIPSLSSSSMMNPATFTSPGKESHPHIFTCIYYLNLECLDENCGVYSKL